MIPRIQTLLKVTTIPFLRRNFNCWTAGIAAKQRGSFLKTYPVTLVLADGSSLNIQYFEPRSIVVLPHNLELMTEEERKIILQKRLPKKKINIVKDEDIEDFNEEQYLKLAKQ